MWGCVPVIPALGKVEDEEFKASLGCQRQNPGNSLKNVISSLGLVARRLQS